MNADPDFHAALDDLTRARAWCTRNQGSPVPRQVVEYIAANAEVLTFFLSALYDGKSRSERESLHAANSTTLDYSAISDATRELAESTITESIHCVAGIPLSLVEEDDVVMLLRAVQYVQHFDGGHPPIPIVKSPLTLP